VHDEYHDKHAGREEIYKTVIKLKNKTIAYLSL
jgi:hypothetical protein